MDRREHHRVQLRIPARLRWTTPFGQKTEVRDTLNVSRGGVLVPCAENHAVGTTLWVTFPYDPSVPFGQPEILARVVRSGSIEPSLASTAKGKMTPSGNGDRDGSTVPHARANESPAAAAALRFDLASHAATNGNGRYREVERRKSPRRLLALPIRVRQEHVPWFEETMTLDVSTEGLRFLSNREYEAGQHLIVSFEPSALALPWPGAAEFRSLVIRVDPVPQSPALAVTIHRVS
jgi:PilZ domain